MPIFHEKPDIQKAPAGTAGAKITADVTIFKSKSPQSTVQFLIPFKSLYFPWQIWKIKVLISNLCSAPSVLK